MPPFFWPTTGAVLAVIFIVGVAIGIVTTRSAPDWLRVLAFIVILIFIVLIFTVTLNH